MGETPVFRPNLDLKRVRGQSNTSLEIESGIFDHKLSSLYTETCDSVSLCHFVLSQIQIAM